MMHRRSSSLMLLPVLALLPALSLFACAGEAPSDDQGVGVVQEPIPTGKTTHLVGTYTNSDYANPGDLSLIALKLDGTYHTETLIECFKAPCDPIAADGHYSLSRQDTTTYISLYFGQTGTLLAKYKYELDGDFLNLLRMVPATDNGWISMMRSPAAWCATNNDCQEQDLLPGPCAGQYICQPQSICNYHCGVLPEE